MHRIQNIIKNGALEINLSLARVTWYGEPVKFGMRTYQTLVYFAHHMGENLHTDKILSDLDFKYNAFMVNMNEIYKRIGTEYIFNVGHKTYAMPYHGEGEKVSNG